MNLYEFEAKSLFQKMDIPIPRDSLEENAKDPPTIRMIVKNY